MPNLDNLRIWIDALRGEEYTQGHRRLTTITPDGTVKHCCLAVACQEAIKHGVELNVTSSSLPLEDYPDSGEYLLYNGEDAILPQATIDWLGDDWKRANEVVQISSYDQETFNNGMNLFLFRLLPIIILFIAIWAASYIA